MAALGAMDARGAPQWASFHQAAALIGIWLIVFFVGVNTMAAMRGVLMPLFWAFFFMMGLVPFTTFVETCLLASFTFAASVVAACFRPLARRLPPAPRWCRCRWCARPGAAASDNEDTEAEHRSAGEWYRQLARFLAVLISIACFLGFIALFLMMIIQSAETMKSNWDWYKKGAVRIAKNLNEMLERVSKLVPEEMVDKVTKNALETLEEALTSLLKPVAENVSTVLVELIMMLLYMAFWLCNPIDISTTVASLFKRYIMMKGIVSALYAGCVWFLLYMLRVDLAVVFGCFTFMLNFVPEVGPFIAAVLPVPVILFDGRLENPWATLAIALGAQLGLKFFFGNIFEVKLIESDVNMKMHPVVILFCVAFFGWIWGPTGMLLSVPIMASVKAVAQREAMPPQYRDGVLRVLEGRGVTTGVQLGPVAVLEQAVQAISSLRGTPLQGSPRPLDEELGECPASSPQRQASAGECPASSPQQQAAAGECPASSPQRHAAAGAAAAGAATPTG